MVIGDQLSDDSALVNYGVLFTSPKGRLIIANIEDEITFERYIDIISKIPDIDTDLARETIREQLIHEASDFESSCIETLAALTPPLKADGMVRFARTVQDYRDLTAEYQIDLLIFNTKKESQLAMSGRSYSLAVELQHMPLLML